MMATNDKPWHQQDGIADVETLEGMPVRLPSWIAPKCIASMPATAFESIFRISKPPALGGEQAEANVVTGSFAHEDTVEDGSSVGPDTFAAASPPRPKTLPPSSIEISLREENALLIARIAELAANAANFRREVLERSVPELVRLATAVAERVLKREVRMEPELIVSWALEAIQTLEHKNGVVIAVSEDLYERIPEEVWNNRITVNHRVEVDSDLGPWQCEIRADTSSVDASSEGRLRAVAGVLGVRDE